MSYSLTKEELFDYIDQEGGVASAIIGYGVDISVVPEDTPSEVKQAWKRIRAIESDIQIINDWLNS